VDKAVVGGAAVGILSLLFPWGSVVGASLSGVSVAAHAPLLWLQPLTLLGCIVVHQRLANAQPIDRMLAMRYILIVATTWTAIGAAVATVGATVISAPGIGLYMAVAGSASVAYGAFMEIGEAAASR
jgi:hypothetical protein